MLVEKLKIAAPAERLWPLVSDLTQMEHWNPKLVSAEPKSDGQPRVGYRARTTWQMNGRQRSFDTRITACDAPRLVAFMHYDDIAKNTFVEERFELVADGEGTLVTHRLDFRNAGIPLIVRGVMWVIDRFGAFVEPIVLEDLKLAIETAPA